MLKKRFMALDFASLTPSRLLKRKACGQLPPDAPSRRARTAAQVKRNRQAAADATVAAYLSRLELKPSSNPLTAQERMQAVLARGRAKLLQGKCAGECAKLTEPGLQ